MAKKRLWVCPRCRISIAAIKKHPKCPGCNQRMPEAKA